MVYLLAFIGLLIAAPLSTIWSGYVLTILWSWFIVPIFNVKELSIIMAIGLALVINFLNNTKIDEKSGESGFEQVWKAIILAITKPAIFLLFGYVFTLFI